MIHATLGRQETGRRPEFPLALSSVYAASGVRSLSDEWGRHRS